MFDIKDQQKLTARCKREEESERENWLRAV